MSINSNFSIYEPEAWTETFQELYFPNRPIVANAATSVAGANLEGLVANAYDTVKITRATKTTTSDVADYTQESDYSYSEPAASENSLVINKHKFIGFKIDKRDQKFSLPDLVRQHMIPRMNSLMDVINADCKTELLKAEAAFYSMGTDAEVMDDSDLREARRILLERKNINPEQGAIAVIDPTVEADLTGLNIFHNADERGNNQIQLEGAMARAFGFNFFVDNLGKDHTVATVTDAVVAAAASAGDTTLTIDNGSGSAATVSLSEGDVVTFGSAKGKDQAYVVQSQTGTVLTLKEALRDDVADDATINPVDIASGDTGREQFFYDPIALSLVTAGMSPVDGSTAGGVRRAIGFDPVNNVNYTLSVEETMAGANILLEALYGVKLFYPDLALRFIRGNEAK